MPGHGLKQTTGKGFGHSHPEQLFSLLNACCMADRACLKGRQQRGYDGACLSDGKPWLLFIETKREDDGASPKCQI